MTTTFTDTVQMTTPNQVLNDVKISSPGNQCINIHGATNFEISNFDCGPSPDSAILNQQHAALPGGHIHDGKVHDVTHGFSYGTHGIYDKGSDTLVERVEGYNISGGQAFSPRWPNRYKNCVAHNTGFAFGHFNYGTQGGTLRIRDCIIYALSSGGFAFYSEGVWYDDSGNILGQSLVTIEIDHCTIDLTSLGAGAASALDFSQCHAAQYVTNCVIVSSVALGSIIRSPSGFTVHTDGTIVISAATAATWLSSAPTYVPLPGGGSPIIGAAVASPAGCLAAWGNAADLGAVQSSGGGGGGGGGGGIGYSGGGLIPNGDFETNVTGWVGNAGTETLSDSGLHSAFGANSMQVVTTGSANSGAKVAPTIAAQANTVYTYTLSVWCPTGQSVIPTLNWYLGGSLIRTYQLPAVAGTSAWQQIIFTSTSPSGIDGVVPSILLAGTPSITMWVDAVSLVSSGHIGAIQNYNYKGSAPDIGAVESIPASPSKTLTDTGATVSDTLGKGARTLRFASDQGANVGSSTVTKAVRILQPVTGATVSDFLVKAAVGTRTSRTASDTGVTITESISLGMKSRTGSDSYTDGPSATFGPSTLSTLQFAVFTDTFNSFAAPKVAPDPYYARLPLSEAQAALSSTAVAPNTYAAVSCSWHGQLTDPERGSFILVRAGGPLEGRVGQRVQILLRGGTGAGNMGGVVYGYVHGVADLDPRDDVSVPRRLFMNLALPGFDRVAVVVETLKPPT